jgi:hypothetical protein
MHSATTIVSECRAQPRHFEVQVTFLTGFANEATSLGLGAAIGCWSFQSIGVSVDGAVQLGEYKEVFVLVQLTTHARATQSTVMCHGLTF